MVAVVTLGAVERPGCALDNHGRTWREHKVVKSVINSGGGALKEETEGGEKEPSFAEK